MHGGPVGPSDLDRGIARLQSTVGEDPRAAAAGPFGPGSMLWHVTREAAVFLCAGRALLLQLAHPWVARAIATHSTALDDPFGRFHRTFGTVYTLVFGSSAQAFATARRLHRRHAQVVGTLGADAGEWPEGSAYAANDAEALLWVHATLVDGALLAHERVLGPLPDDDRERYYDDCRRLGGLFGLDEAAQPRDWGEFERWRDAMLASPRIAVGAEARRIGLGLLSGAGRVPVPRWYSDVTAGLLPPGVRADYGLPFGARERRRAERAWRLARGVYPRVPVAVRYVAPYHEALARLRGRAPGLLTTTLNRLWIGRARLDARAGP